VIQEFNILIANTALVVIISTIGLIGYIIHYVLNNKTFTGIALTNGLTVGASYAAIMGGLRVWFLCFDEKACKAAGIEWGYFFIAGIATMWMAIEVIGKQHSSINKKTI
jgi:hypothetical protein